VGAGRETPGFFGNTARGLHFEKSIATCIVAAQKHAGERIQGKKSKHLGGILRFWAKNPSKSETKQALTVSLAPRH
jgi:hypothetical protein